MTVQFTCTGPGLPTWYVNGRITESKGNCYRLTIRRAAGMNVATILTINGNQTCDTFNVYCGIVVSESQLLYARNVSQFSLVFQGLLQTWFSIPAVINTNQLLRQCFINNYNKLMLQFCSSQVIFLHLKIFT